MQGQEGENVKERSSRAETRSLKVQPKLHRFDSLQQWLLFELLFVRVVAGSCSRPELCVSMDDKNKRSLGSSLHKVTKLQLPFILARAKRQRSTSCSSCCCWFKLLPWFVRAKSRLVYKRTAAFRGLVYKDQFRRDKGENLFLLFVSSRRSCYLLSSNHPDIQTSQDLTPFASAQAIHSALLFPGLSREKMKHKRWISVARIQTPPIRFEAGIADREFNQSQRESTSI